MRAGRFGPLSAAIQVSGAPKATCGLDELDLETSIQHLV